MEKEKDDLGYCHYLKQARMALAEEQFEEALKFYDEAILSKDCGASVYYLKCELLFLLNRIEEAVALITKFGHQQNNIIFTLFLTSKHFEYQGKMDEATYWWEKYQDRIHGREHYYPEKNHKNSLRLISGGIN